MLTRLPEFVLLTPAGRVVDFARPKPLIEPVNVLYADCPWQPRDKLPGKRGAAHKYETQKLEYLTNFKLPPIADDAVLFFWRLSSMQQEALDVVRAWGFTVTSEIIWQKLTKKGKPWFGMGRTVRASHETCIIGTRGRYRRVFTARDLRSTFEAKVPVSADGHYIHSGKPPEMYDIIEHACPGASYYELFARPLRDGWHQEGDQLGVAA